MCLYLNPWTEPERAMLQDIIGHAVHEIEEIVPRCRESSAFAQDRTDSDLSTLERRDVARYVHSGIIPHIRQHGTGGVFCLARFWRERSCCKASNWQEEH